MYSSIRFEEGRRRQDRRRAEHRRNHHRPDAERARGGDLLQDPVPQPSDQAQDRPGVPGRRRPARRPTSPAGPSRSCSATPASFTFMDLEDYSQFTLAKDDIEEEWPYLVRRPRRRAGHDVGRPGARPRAADDGHPEITDTRPSMKGGSVTARTKPATAGERPGRPGARIPIQRRGDPGGHADGRVRRQGVNRGRSEEISDD